MFWGIKSPNDFDVNQKRSPSFFSFRSLFIMVSNVLFICHRTFLISVYDLYSNVCDL